MQGRRHIGREVSRHDVKSTALVDLILKNQERPLRLPFFLRGGNDIIFSGSVNKTKEEVRIFVLALGEGHQIDSLTFLLFSRPSPEYAITPARGRYLKCTLTCCIRAGE